MQPAIWYTTVDTDTGSGFSYTGGSAGMLTDYDNLISFSGYNPGSVYGADFYETQHNGNLYQDLVTVGSVPEPSTVVLGSIGFTLVVLWGRFRKSKSA
jgi:hypothetical protein